MKSWGTAAAVITGKACALYVLLMSLSGRITEITGYEYFQYPSFAFCALVAILFVLAVPLLSGGPARRIFALLSLLLCSLWCLLLLWQFWIEKSGSDAAAVLGVAIGVCGRLATLFINIQWNFHFSLKRATDVAWYTSGAVLSSVALFLFSNLMSAHAALTLMLFAAVASAVINFGFVGIQKNAELLDEAIKSQSLSRNDVIKESVPRTRVLYFGARVLYGAALGFTLCLSTLAPADASESPLLIVVALLATLLLLGGVLTLGRESRSSLYFVVVTPIFSICFIIVSFFDNSPLGLVSLGALMAEIVWSTQNLFQLPLYLKMTAIRPSTFAYYEYAAQIIPFYIAVAAFSYPTSAIIPFELIPLLVVSATSILVFFSAGALIRHILNYQPTASADEPIVSDMNEKEKLSAYFQQLTARECDVLALLANGYSGPYIAKTLYLANGTVKTHIRHIYDKLRVSSQDELIELVSRTIGKSAIK